MTRPNESPPPFTLLFRDDDLVVVAKPSGVPTHPGKGCRTGGSALQQVRNAVGRWVYPAHRLDSGTSGVLVFALTPEMAASLGEAFASRAVDKRYVAVARGFTPDTGVVEHALKNERSEIMQDAYTEYRTLARAELPWPVRPYASARYSLVELTPRTGRTHQLRRHLNHISHPIVGDTRFGDCAHNKAFAERTGIRRLLLHASWLRMPHPRTGEPLEFTAPWDAGFAEAAGLVTGAVSAPGEVAFEAPQAPQAFN